MDWIRQSISSMLMTWIEIMYGLLPAPATVGPASEPVDGRTSSGDAFPPGRPAVHLARVIGPPGWLSPPGSGGPRWVFRSWLRCSLADPFSAW